MKGNLSEQRADEDLDADHDEDDTAKDGCLACDFITELLADIDAAEAEAEGDETDDKNRNKRFKEGVVCNCEAY